MKLSNLRFADDVVLMLELKSELPQMIQSLKDSSQQYGLKMNLEKTKILSDTDDDDYEIGT
jgi:Reverse transcriptase (RNA-dependent DNA polymerase)